MKRRVAAILGGIVLLGVAAVLWFLEDQADRFSSALGCSPKVLKQVESPAGGNVAVLFEMECGATTGFNTQLTITPRGQGLSLEKYPAILILDGQHNIPITWESEARVAVHVPSAVVVYKKETAARGVRVSYE